MKFEILSLDSAKKLSIYDKNLKQKIEYKKRIDTAIEYMNNYIEVEDAPINERIKIEFKEVLNILQGENNE